MKPTVLLVMLCVAGPAAAQEVDRRGFIGLGFGPSQPIGAFGKPSSAGAGAGNAAGGYTQTMLSLGYRFVTRLGVAATYSGSEFMMRDATDDTEWFQVSGLTVGPMYSHRLNPRAAVDLKAMVGLMRLTPGYDPYLFQSAETASAGGVDLRLTVRYDVMRRWALFVEGGIQASNVSFDSGRQTDYRALITGIGLAFRPRW